MSETTATVVGAAQVVETVAAVVSAAVPGAAVAAAPIGVVAAAIAADPAPIEDLIGQVPKLVALHEANSVRIDAAEAALGDVLAFLTHAFPSMFKRG